MAKNLITLVLLCASLSARVAASPRAAADDAGKPEASSAQSVNPVIERNRTLLGIVRTHGAQSPTIHSTLSFAFLHSSVYDAINNIDGTFSTYFFLHPKVSRPASYQLAHY